jgi:hypothetical protein
LALIDPLYLTGQDPIYHTLEPGAGGESMAGDTSAATIEVMLPSGQLVPATLVRNATGRIVPLVQVPCDYDDDNRLADAATRWNTTRHHHSGSSRRGGDGRHQDTNGGGLQDGPGRFSTRARTNRPMGYQYRV